MITDPFIDIKEIKSELKDIQGTGESLALKLSILAQKIKYIFTKIKSSESMESAQEYFNILESVQSVLARLVFKEEIGIPDRLDRFVRDFDNLEAYQKYYYDKIRSGEYSF